LLLVSATRRVVAAAALAGSTAAAKGVEKEASRGKEESIQLEAPLPASVTTLPERLSERMRLLPLSAT